MHRNHGYANGRMGCHYAIIGMAKLLVGLTLFLHCHEPVAGDKIMREVELDASTSAGSVTTSAFFGWGCKPYFPWWPVDYCAWDFSITGIWQITFTGGACNGPYGAKLAAYARKTMTSNRGFKGIMTGVSPATSTVMCAKGSKVGQVIYTIQVQAPSTPAGRQMMQRLRSANGGGFILARNMYVHSGELAHYRALQR